MRFLVAVTLLASLGSISAESVTIPDQGNSNGNSLIINTNKEDGPSNGANNGGSNGVSYNTAPNSTNTIVTNTSGGNVMPGNKSTNTITITVNGNNQRVLSTGVANSGIQIQDTNGQNAGYIGVNGYVYSPSDQLIGYMDNDGRTARSYSVIIGTRRGGSLGVNGQHQNCTPDGWYNGAPYWPHGCGPQSGTTVNMDGVGGGSVGSGGAMTYQLPSSTPVGGAVGDATSNVHWVPGVGGAAGYWAYKNGPGNSTGQVKGGYKGGYHGGYGSGYYGYYGSGHRGGYGSGHYSGYGPGNRGGYGPGNRGGYGPGYRGGYGRTNGVSHNTAPNSTNTIVNNTSGGNVMPGNGVGLGGSSVNIVYDGVGSTGVYTSPVIQIGGVAVGGAGGAVGGVSAVEGGLAGASTYQGRGGTHGGYGTGYRDGYRSGRLLSPLNDGGSDGVSHNTAPNSTSTVVTNISGGNVMPGNGVGLGGGSVGIGDGGVGTGGVYNMAPIMPVGSVGVGGAGGAVGGGGASTGGIYPLGVVIPVGNRTGIGSGVYGGGYGSDYGPGGYGGYGRGRRG